MTAVAIEAARYKEFETTVAGKTVKVMPELQTTYNSQYMMNKVTSYRSGHMFEVDETPGAERIRAMHKSGTYMEMHANGDWQMRTNHDKKEVVVANNTLTVKGNYTIYVEGGANIKVVGDTNLEVTGNLTSNVGANWTHNVVNNVDVTVGQNMTFTVAGATTIDSSGPMTLKGSQIQLNP